MEHETKHVYHEHENSNDVLSTVLVIILLLLLIGFGVWYFTTQSWQNRAQETTEEQPNNSVLEINVGDNDSETTPSSTTETSSE